ncbi:MAG: PQQ-binding-like beta-propeller repeat protein [Candidatus Eremiobacterota bacterium]
MQIGVVGRPLATSGKGPNLEEAVRFLDRYDPNLAREDWSQEVPGGWMYEPTVNRQGTIFVGGGSGNLLAFDPKGAILWSQPTGTVLHAPALSPDQSRVYAASMDNRLVCLDPSGQVVWERSLGYGGLGEPTVGPDGTIYVGSLANQVVAFDPRGELLWTSPTEGAVQTRPAVGPDGTVYARDNRGNVMALDPRDGKPRWTLETQGYDGGPIAVHPDGFVVVTDWKDVKFVDAAGGGLIRSVPANTGREAGPAIGPDGTIYLAGWDGNLTALNPDGTRKWVVHAEVGLATTPRLAADGTIVSRGHDRRILAFHPEGRLLWQSPTYQYNGASIMSEPAVAPDGTVYAGNQNSTLVALRFVSPEEQFREASQVPGKGNGVLLGEDWILVGGTRLRKRRF